MKLIPGARCATLRCADHPGRQAASLVAVPARDTPASPAASQASGECWRDCFVQPRGRWSNLVCSHRPEIVSIFRNDTGRRVLHRGRQHVCAPPGESEKGTGDAQARVLKRTRSGDTVKARL